MAEFFELGLKNKNLIEGNTETLAPHGSKILKTVSALNKRPSRNNRFKNLQSQTNFSL